MSQGGWPHDILEYSHSLNEKILILLVTRIKLGKVKVQWPLILQLHSTEIH